MKPDTTPRGSSGRIEGQLDIDEAIQIAETGSDGKPRVCECGHSGFWHRDFGCEYHSEDGSVCGCDR